MDFPIPVKDKTVILNVGRLAEQKDQVTLLRAFRIFKQTHANAVLFILGEGPLHSLLEEHIRINKLSSCVFLMGFEPNPYKWMAKCDVLVLSSIFEGFGNVLVEAMALGKTVVSTNCPSGPAEILNKGEYGYLCPVKDPSGLSNAISRAITFPFDKNLLTEYSQRYTTTAIVEKFIEIL